jgi:hypothetical protein
MGRIVWYLMGGLLISTLLLHLSIWGLWQTGNPLYLIALTCCLYTLLFSAHHFLTLILQRNNSPAQICVVVINKNSEPQPDYDPLYFKVKNRL